MVRSGGDWLACQKETGQTPKQYSNGGPHITWSTPRKKTIILFIMDASISEELGEKLRTYCEAFFHGCKVKIARPGTTLTDAGRAGAKNTKKIPEDFVKAHNITERENVFSSYGKQMKTTEIINALKEYKMSDTYAICALTAVDLYPKDDWNFVYGSASLTHQVGVTSLARSMEGTSSSLTESEKESLYLKLACGTMVHEICHMFGFKHCIYYECTMNGSMGCTERVARPDDGMCPMCTYKLKANVGFDTR